LDIGRLPGGRTQRAQRGGASRGAVRGGGLASAGAVGGEEDALGGRGEAGGGGGGRGGQKGGVGRQVGGGPGKQAAPSSAAGCITPLAFIQNDARFKKLTQLIDATPPAARLADILDSPDVAITMLAPTDDAIADSLGKQGLSFSDLVANPTLSLMVLQFHLLPNPIPDIPPSPLIRFTPRCSRVGPSTETRNGHVCRDKVDYWCWRQDRFPDRHSGHLLPPL
jgi:hypothetical protein